MDYVLHPICLEQNTCPQLAANIKSNAVLGKEREGSD